MPGAICRTEKNDQPDQQKYFCRSDLSCISLESPVASLHLPAFACRQTVHKQTPFSLILDKGSRQ